MRGPGLMNRRKNRNHNQWPERRFLSKELMPRTVTHTRNSAEATLRKADEYRAKQEAAVEEVLPGLPKDIDTIEIGRMTSKTLKTLGKWEKSLPGETDEIADDQVEAKFVINALKEYIAHYAETPTTREENAQKAAELEEMYGEDIARMALAEYRHEFIQVLSFVNELATERDNITPTLSMMTQLLKRTDSFEYDFDDDTSLATTLVTRYGNEENARKIITAVNLMSTQMRHPFGEHVQNLLDNFEGNDRGKMELVTHLLREEETRMDRFRTAMELVDTVVPNRETTQTEKKEDSLGIVDYSEYDHLLVEAAQGETENLVRDAKGRLSESALFDTLRKHKEKTAHEHYSVKEYGMVTVGTGAQAQRVNFSIQVERGVIYEYMYRGNRKGTLGVDGRTTWNARDFDIVAVPKHTWKLDTLVKAEDMLELLENHYREDETNPNIIHTLKVMPDGEVKVLSLTKQEYGVMVKSARDAQERFVKKYKKLGANVDTIRQEQRKKHYLETNEAGPRSWIEQQRALNGISETAEAMAGRTGDGQLQTHIVHATGRLQELVATTQNYYGSSSKYELLARQNLYDIGLYESSPEWSDALANEINNISVEMAQRDYILAELSAEIQTRFRDLQRIRHATGMSPEERAAAAMDMEMELRELLRNVDYTFEMRLVARMSMLAVDAKGSRLYESYTQSLNEVRTNYEPLLRQRVEYKNMEKLRIAAHISRGEVTRADTTMMEYSRRITRETKGPVKRLAHETAEMAAISSRYKEQLDTLVKTAEGVSTPTVDMQKFEDTIQKFADAVEKSVAEQKVGKDYETALEEAKLLVVMFGNQGAQETLQEHFEFLENSGWMDALIEQKQRLEDTIQNMPTGLEITLQPQVEQARNITLETTPIDEVELTMDMYDTVGAFVDRYEEAVTTITGQLGQEVDRIAAEQPGDETNARNRAAELEEVIGRAMNTEEYMRIRDEVLEKSADFKVEVLQDLVKDINGWTEQLTNEEMNPIEYAELAMSTAGNITP
jgi:hypothetical protein